MSRPSLRQRHLQALAASYLDLPVEHYDGLFVRLRALSAEQIAESQQRHGSAKDAGLKVARELLQAACVGVYDVVGDKGVSPVQDPRFDGVVDLATGELVGALPTFLDGEELAAELGVDPSATAVIDALLGVRSSLGVIGYADALADFSDTSSADLLRKARGNSSAATPTSRPPQ